LGAGASSAYPRAVHRPWIATTLVLALVASASVVDLPGAFEEGDEGKVAALKSTHRHSSRLTKRLSDTHPDARRSATELDAAPPPSIDLPSGPWPFVRIAYAASIQQADARCAHVAESRAPPSA